MITINIAQDFTDTPGPRYQKDGQFSGEEFRNKILEPKFLEAKSNKQKLIIDLDGGYGYPSSFLEEAFGGLARLYEIKEVLSVLEFISTEEPLLENRIKLYIEKARDEK